MLERTLQSTKAFVETMPKAERKAYGQFFTTQKTARFMASLFQIDLSLPKIRILDAGAGTGVLSVALAQKILQLGYTGNHVDRQSIKLTQYIDEYQSYQEILYRLI